MATPTSSLRRPGTAEDGPRYVAHPSFDEESAERDYAALAEEVKRADASSYLPDDVTRACARCMHHAAHRVHRARTASERRRWQLAYFDFRDRIVLGNRKLIFRAVSRWMPPSQWAEDLASDCHVVLIQAVAAYNPWMGIRFSTYAFTCLMRALSRLAQRHSTDRLSHSLPLESLPDGEPRDLDSDEPPSARLQRIDLFLQENNDLLSAREKRVLIRRFSLDDRANAGTLEQVGKELGLSKERVRQVQATALEKLRRAMTEPTTAI